MITKGLIFPPFANKDKILLPVPDKFVKGFEAFSLTFDGQIETTETVNLLPDLGVNKHYIITNGHARSIRDANVDNDFYTLECYTFDLKLFHVSGTNFMENIRQAGSQFDLYVLYIMNEIFCRKLDIHYSTENDSEFNIYLAGYILTLNDL